MIEPVPEEKKERQTVIGRPISMIEPVPEEKKELQTLLPRSFQETVNIATEIEKRNRSGIEIDKVDIKLMLRNHKAEKPINLLILGPPGHGKSSLANSFFRYFTKKTVTPCTTSSGQRGTVRYDIVPGLSNVTQFRVFDIPGITDIKNKKDLIEKFLDGIESSTHIDDLERARRDIGNKINFVIMVYSCIDFEDRNGFFLNSFFPNLKDPSDWIDQELYNIIEKKNRSSAHVGVNTFG